MTVHGRRRRGCSDHSVSRSLVIVDESPVLEQAWNEYDRATTRLRAAQAAAIQFATVDLPSFNEWARQTLPLEWERHRILDSRLREQRELYDAAKAAATADGLDLSTALANLLAQRETARRSNPHSPSKCNTPPIPDPDPVREDGGFDAFMQRMEQEFSDTLGATSLRTARRARLEAEYIQQHEHRARRLRTTYRRLARLLHPDMRDQTSNSPQELEELWLSAQQAYHRKQPDLLDRLLEITQVVVNGRRAPTQVSLLRRLAQDAQRQVTALNLQLSRNRRHPAWMFSAETNLAQLQTRVSDWLEADLNRMETEIARIIHRLKPPAPRTRPRHVAGTRSRRQGIGNDRFRV